MKIKSIYSIITALAVTALAQASEDQQRTVAVGQVLSFHLLNTTESEIRLKKDNQYIVLKVKKNKIYYRREEYANHIKLFTNGTLTLGKATKKHSGEYTLEEYGLDGILLRTLNMHIEVKAPVSKPAVSQVCLSPDLMNISCSSEGEEAEYVLTLDDVLLVQTGDQSQLLNSKQEVMRSLSWTKTEQEERNVTKVTISLPSELSGNLKCHVWNNVSREETVFHLNSCKGSPFSALVAVTVSVLAVLLLVALGCGLIILRRKQTDTAVTEDESQDEIIYSTVRVVQRRATAEPI